MNMMTMMMFDTWENLLKMKPGFWLMKLIIQETMKKNMSRHSNLKDVAYLSCSWLQKKNAHSCPNYPIDGFKQYFGKQAKSPSAEHLNYLSEVLNDGSNSTLLVYIPGLDFIDAFFGCLKAKFLSVPVLPLDPL